MRHVAAGTHPVDLTGGRMVAPGEVVGIDPADPHHATLIDAGQLTPIPEPPTPDPPAVPPRSRRKPQVEED